MNSRFNKLKYWLPIISAVTLVIGIWLGWILGRSNKFSPGVEKLHELLDVIDKEYVDQVDIDSLIERSIPSILGNLDPHSAYISLEEIQSEQDELDGSFSGIGIQFQVVNDTICVIEVISGGPCQKVGIMAGDRIINVDGESVASKGLSTDDIFKKLRGPKDSKVTLDVQRPDVAKLLKFNITRGDIPVTTIDAAYMYDKNTGYVKINKFGRNTYSEFLTALMTLRDKGATQYIIDLRGNTGGYMETAIVMVNEFLPARQVIIATHGRNHDDDQIVLSDGNGSMKDTPITILIDEMSASSSEIFSGAMQDNDRGLVIGRRSFGKGLVQRQIKMNDGSELRLTVQRYYTPSGRCIQKEYKPGKNEDYELEVIDRYYNGEMMSEDSVKLNKSLIYHTTHGRTVYGGGGIMPDIFIPNDTTGVTKYYVNVMNNGLINKYAYEYTDMNRSTLTKAKSLDQLLKMLPSDEVLLNSFVQYAADNGIPKRWYYISASRELILTQLKGLIGRDVLGIEAYYKLINAIDPTVIRAHKELQSGNAKYPIKQTNSVKK